MRIVKYAQEGMSREEEDGSCAWCVSAGWLYEKDPLHHGSGLWIKIIKYVRGGGA